MGFIIIDAHSHLWLKQDTVVEGLPIRTLENGRSLFMGEVRQMETDASPVHDRWSKQCRSVLI